MNKIDITLLKERIFGNFFGFINHIFIKDSFFYEAYFLSNESFKKKEIKQRDKKKENIFSLEEILEELLKEKSNILRNQNLDDEILKEKTLQEKVSRLNNISFIVEEEKLDDKKIFLYEIFPNTYYVYLKRNISSKNEKKEEEKDKNRILKDDIYGSFGYFSLFVPTGVVVNRVPQSVLGNGVLGRAFIYQNYIEILDSLVGNEYIEVLTHEVLHIMYPEKKEMEIRMITRNYLGNTTYN